MNNASEQPLLVSVEGFKPNLPLNVVSSAEEVRILLADLPLMTLSAEDAGALSHMLELAANT